MPAGQLAGATALAVMVTGVATALLFAGDVIVRVPFVVEANRDEPNENSRTMDFMVPPFCLVAYTKKRLGRRESRLRYSGQPTYVNNLQIRAVSTNSGRKRMTEQKEPVPGLRFREALCTTQNTSRAAGPPSWAIP